MTKQEFPTIMTSPDKIYFATQSEGSCRQDSMPGTHWYPFYLQQRPTYPSATKLHRNVSHFSHHWILPIHRILERGALRSSPSGRAVPRKIKTVIRTGFRWPQRGRSPSLGSQSCGGQETVLLLSLNNNLMFWQLKSTWKTSVWNPKQYFD